MAGSTGAPANARAAQLLLRATRHTVDALAREGRLPSEQAALLRALLLRESHPVEPSMGGDRPDVQRDPAGEGVVVGGGGGGWAALPEGVEDGVFSALRNTMEGSLYVHGNGDNTRLVCKQWKRAAARNFTILRCPYSLADLAPAWATNLKQRFPTLTRLTLEGGSLHASRGTGLGHIARASKGARPRDLGLALHAIGGMASLTSLDIAQLIGGLRHPSGLLALQHLTRLESLDCGLDFEPVMHLLLPQLPRLRSLRMGARMPTRCLRPVSALRHLEHLAVHAPADLAELMAVVAPITSLRKLWPARSPEMAIFSAGLAPGAMRDLATALPGLESLELQDCVCLASSLCELRRMPRLGTLIIGSVFTMDALVEGALPQPGLRDFPALQTLNISGIHGAELLPGGDISLLVPRALASLSLSFVVPWGQTGSVDADRFVRAIAAAPGLASIHLHRVLDLPLGEEGR
eukprot:jgi/Tetstr1/458578/TSEL_044981.t1